MSSGMEVVDFFEAGKRIARIRTSDRSTFRRCRRKWHWSSHLRSNLESNRLAEPLWLGKAFHYGLEDYHGYNLYKKPSMAFKAFVHAYKQAASYSRHPQEVPSNLDENIELGIGMFEHYEQWLKRRDPLRTYIYKGVPQCEVNFEIPLPFDCSKIPNCPYDSVVYGGTLDRVVIDDYGRLWIVEYKTAIQTQDGHFDVDGQVSAYCWAAWCIYELPVEGVIYQQHWKQLPHQPKLLANGTYSTNKQQNTTWGYYYEALKNLYGSQDRFPSGNVEMLNNLAEFETEDRDKYIRRDRIERNMSQLQAEGDKILLELEDMLNPSLPLYPNPTRDCSWDCKQFHSACVMLDSGSDWEEEIKATCRTREEWGVNEDWRQYLPDPDTFLNAA